jgi:hypothetical protein
VARGETWLGHASISSSMGAVDGDLHVGALMETIPEVDVTGVGKRMQDHIPKLMQLVSLLCFLCLVHSPHCFSLYLLVFLPVQAADLERY